MGKITAVLITRGREYPKLILDRLETGFFDEILIKFNSPLKYTQAVRIVFEMELS